MKHLLSETRFYFAQCVFNTSCHYSAVERIEKQRASRQNWAGNWYFIGICSYFGLYMFGLGAKLGDGVESYLYYQCNINCCIYDI